MTTSYTSDYTSAQYWTEVSSFFGWETNCFVEASASTPSEDSPQAASPNGDEAYTSAQYWTEVCGIFGWESCSFAVEPSVEPSVEQAPAKETPVEPSVKEVSYTSGSYWAVVSGIFGFTEDVFTKAAAKVALAKSYCSSDYWSAISKFFTGGFPAFEFFEAAAS